MGSPIRAVLQVLRFYQTFSFGGLIPVCCRFLPSCSCYAEEAFRRHGIRRGFLLTFRRLLKCHPWHPGGWDPVPADET